MKKTGRNLFGYLWFHKEAIFDYYFLKWLLNILQAKPGLLIFLMFNNMVSDEGYFLCI